jgi:hypothetical protein
MKRTMMCAALMLLGCQTASAQAITVDDFAWLAGCWAGANGKSTFREHWMRPEGGIMLGMGRTMRDGKLASFEAMRIEPDADGKIGFVATPSRRAETRFALLKKEGARYVFENPRTDFPQRVIYEKNEDGSLAARIEGEVNGKARAIDFPMRRVACE